MPQHVPAKKGVSNRCFVEYEIDIQGTAIRLQTPVLFKKVVKIGTKFVVIAELLGTIVPEYVLEICQVSAMHYIPLSAKYIDSVMISGDKLIHFFAQPQGASTDTTMVKELAASEMRRANTPPREEDLATNGKAALRERLRKEHGN